MTIREEAINLLDVPCDDAISRQAVLKLFATHDGRYLYEAIRDLPSVTPQEPCEDATLKDIFCMGCEYKEQEPKTGYWIETADEYYKAVNEYGGGVDEDTPYFTDDIGCSVCLAMFSTIDNETERFKYCPNCGARMESEEQA